MADMRVPTGTGTATEPVIPQDTEPCLHGLVLAFNAVRAELVSTLFHMLGNHADAQDAAQEAFLKCWRARDTIADVRDLRAWVFRVAVNAARDLRRNAWCRRARPLEGPALSSGAPGDSPVAAAQDLELRDRLRAALRSLRPDEREVFLLRENSPLSFDEIAAMQGCPVGTVKTRMRAAIRKLRAVLREK
jgi:RNA polymerase sigma-70 factor (ECF subfamily)